MGKKPAPASMNKEGYTKEFTILSALCTFAIFSSARALLAKSQLMGGGGS